VKIKRLEQFLAVFDWGSFAVAARQLGMSQGALSIAIQTLERELGTSLFDRTHRGTIPNNYGRALEPRARAIKIAAGRVQGELHELLGVERGRVRIGASPLFADRILPIAVARFYEAHPTVEVAIIEGYTGTIVAAVMSGELDCAFSLAGPHLAAPELASEMLLPRQRVIIVAAAGHRLASRLRVTPHEAWEEPWVLPAPPDVYRLRLGDFFARFNLPLPRAVIEYSSIAMEKSILRLGRHIGSMAGLMAREEILSGALRILAVPELTWATDAGVVYRAETPLMPGARKFIEIVRGVCKELSTAEERNGREHKAIADHRRGGTQIYTRSSERDAARRRTRRRLASRQD
jgi:DNA-binding transcriptional LysR family regulator